ncbi:MAG: tripartite tricarboxylate transporter permease [Gemmatimonadetes bacterium]|nr:tripartite tricarboxylate transporter permease [Gemmatimonadota bacterium]
MRGIAASEAANSAMAPGPPIPLPTLGIPGSPPAAVTGAPHALFHCVLPVLPPAGVWGTERNASRRTRAIGRDGSGGAPSRRLPHPQAGRYRSPGEVRRPHAVDAAASDVSSTPAPVRTRCDGQDTAAVIEALTAVAAATGSSRWRV